MFDGALVPRRHSVQDTHEPWVHPVLAHLLILVALLGLATLTAALPRYAPAYIQPGPGLAAGDKAPFTLPL